MGAVGGLVRSVNGVLATMGVGVGLYGFVRLLRGAEEFNQKMLNSLAIMGNVSDKTQQEMRDAAFATARVTRYSATQVAESYYYLVSAGLNAQQSIAAMPAVAQFAQAGMFDMAQATSLAADAQSALGMKCSDAQENLKNLVHVTDVLVKANTLANATVQQFSQSITTKAGAAAKIVGKDIEELAAVLAAFADQGVKGSEAGMAINIVFRELQSKAIDNATVFTKFGVTVFDATGEMANAADIVRDLEEALSGMSDEQKKATLLEMGFTDRSMIFIQTLMGTSDKIRRYESELRKAGGTTKEVADKQMTPLQKGMAALGASFTKLSSEIMRTSIGPALSKIFTGMSQILEMLPTLVDRFGWIIDAIKFAVIAWGAYFVATKAAAAATAVMLALSGGGAGLIRLAAGIIAGSIAVGVLDATLAGVERSMRKTQVEAKGVEESIKKVANTKPGVRKLREEFEDLARSMDKIGEEGERSIEAMRKGYESLSKELGVATGELIRRQTALAKGGLEAATAGDPAEIEAWVKRLTDRLKSMKEMLELFGGFPEIAEFMAEALEVLPELRPAEERIEELRLKLRSLVQAELLPAADASALFLDAWKESPLSKPVEMLSEMAEEAFSLTNHLDEAGKSLREFMKLKPRPDQVAEFKRLQEAITKARTDLEMAELGESIRKELMTPVEKATERFRELYEMREELGKETYERALMGLQKELTGEQAPALTGRFSPEQYGKSLQDLFLKSDDPAKKTAANTAEANRILDEIKTEIAGLNGANGVAVFVK